MGHHPCKKFKRSCSQCNSMSLAMAQPNILKLVLSFLSAKELSSAPYIVSRLWNEVSMGLIAKRQCFSLMLVSEADKYEGGPLSATGTFLDLSYFKPRKMFVLTSKKLLPSPKYIRDNSKKLCYSEVSKMNAHRMMAYFTKRELLPSDCELYAISSFGVFGIMGNKPCLDSTSENEINELNYGAISVLFSQNFSDHIRFYSLPSNLYDENLTEDLLKTHLGCPPQDPIKFLLYLSAQHGDFPRILLGQIIGILPNLVVTGALIDQHSLYSEDNQSKITPDCISGLAVLGNEATCSCLVLDDRCRTESDIERQIHKFRNSVGLLGDECLAILVFCLARSTASDIKYFKKYFAGVPAVGLYGYGEFGRNVTAGLCSDPYQNYDHSYSTVISVINFNP